MTLPRSAAELFPCLEQIKTAPTCCRQLMPIIGEKRMNNFNVASQKFFYS